MTDEDAVDQHVRLAERAKAEGTPGYVLGAQYEQGSRLDEAHFLVTGNRPDTVSVKEWAHLNAAQQAQARLLHSRLNPAT